MRNEHIDFFSDSSLLFISDKLFVSLDQEIWHTILLIIQRDTKKKRGDNLTLAMIQRVNDLKIKEAQVNNIKRTIKSTGEQSYMSVQVHHTSNSTEYKQQMAITMGTRYRDQTSFLTLASGS